MEEVIKNQSDVVFQLSRAISERVQLRKSNAIETWLNTYRYAIVLKLELKIQRDVQVKFVYAIFILLSSSRAFYGFYSRALFGQM